MKPYKKNMNKPYNNYQKQQQIRQDVLTIGSVLPDLDLLKVLVEKQSPSKTTEEAAFIQWLSAYCSKKGYEVTKDSHRNIYVTKGFSSAFPCIVAHTDTNQDLHSSLELVRIGDILMGWNKLKGTQCGAGFDDKVGILIALQCLEIFENIKAFFPALEEVGYIGSSKANMKFFDDVGYCFQPDRNSRKNDICSYTNGTDTASKEFISTLAHVMLNYDYKEAQGVGTDIGELKWNGLKCSAVNVSCGYFREHYDEEVCSVSLLHNCLNFIVDSIQYLGETKFNHEVNTRKAKGQKGGYYGGWEYDAWEYDKKPVEVTKEVWYVFLKGSLIKATEKELQYLEYKHCPECISELEVLTWNDAQDVVEWKCPQCKIKYVNAYVSDKSDKADKEDW